MKWIIKKGQCYYKKDGKKSEWWKDKGKATQFSSIVEVMSICERYGAVYEEVNLDE